MRRGRSRKKMVVRARQGQTPVVEGHCRGRPTDRARSGEASQNRLPPLPLAAAGGGGGGALQTRTYLHFTLIFLPRRSFRITSIMINSQQGRLARVCESTPRGAQPAAAPLHTASALSHPLQQKCLHSVRDETFSYDGKMTSPAEQTPRFACSL